MSLDWVGKEKRLTIEARNGMQINHEQPPKRGLAELAIWKKALLLGGVIVVACAVVWGIDRVRTVQEWIGFGKNVKDDYQALAADFEFTAPEPEATLETTKWRTILEIRQGAYAPLAEVAMDPLARLLDAEQPGRIELLRRLDSLRPTLREAVQIHQQQLREKEISPEAYSWWVGYLIGGALSNPEEFVVAEEYQRWLERFSAFTRRDETPQNDFDAEAFAEALIERYADYPPPPAHQVNALAKTPSDLGFAFDLLAVGLQMN